MKINWFGVAVAIAASVGVWNVIRYMGEEQQLRRACWNAAQESLVSPATATLADFSIHRAGSNLETLAKIDNEITQVNELIEQAQALVDRSTEQMNSASTGDIDHQPVDVTLASFQTSAKAAKLVLEGRSIVNDQQTLLSELQAKRKKAVDLRVAEVWMDVDSQNRAGAMLRSKAVCAFYDTGKPASVDSIELVGVASR